MFDEAFVETRVTCVCPETNPVPVTVIGVLAFTGPDETESPVTFGRLSGVVELLMVMPAPQVLVQMPGFTDGKPIA